MPERVRSSGGVVVMGMHRSGTSVATEAITCLGPSPCVSGDRLGPGPANPRGHWESHSLMHFNEALLERLGGWWWCPPTHPIDLAALDDQLDEARRRFAAVHLAERWVWKDPRNALLLPFWRRALGRRLAVVLVLRHPLDIARSLQQRDHLSLDWSLALWERYLRAALASCAGLPLLVTSYDRLIADSAAWAGGMTAFLDATGLRLEGPIDYAAVQRCVDPQLRHSAHDWPAVSPKGELSTVRSELLGTARSLLGVHPTFAAPRLGPESEETRDFLLGLRDRHQSPGRVRGARAADRPGPSPLAGNGRAGPDRSTGSRRSAGSGTQQVSVILTGAPGSIPSAVENLRATAGEDLEVLLADPSRAAAAATAGGEIIVFGDARVRPSQGWLEPLLAMLAEPDIGAAGPAIASPRRPAQPAIGLTFVDRCLNVGWLPARGPDPAEVPLLAGCVLAVRRDAYHRVGGLDAVAAGSGCAELELCLRLWRCGLACVGVPTSRVTHASRDDPATAAGSHEGRADPWRMAALHFGSERLASHVAALVAARPDASAAFGGLLSGDLGRARERIQAMCVHDDAWFFDRFQIKAFSSEERMEGREYTAA